MPLDLLTKEVGSEELDWDARFRINAKVYVTARVGVSARYRVIARFCATTRLRVRDGQATIASLSKDDRTPLQCFKEAFRLKNQTIEVLEAYS